ncbi:MAG: hypothetical protein ACREGG_01535 [Candidatus Saccharimonadales bacterium]
MSELYVDDILGEPIDPNLSVYAPPEGLKDVDDRIEGNKKFILYVGEIAILDVLLMGPNSDEEPLALLDRLEADRGEARDLIVNPQRHADEEVARNIFDKKWLTEEEINQIVGLREAA